MGKIFVGRPSVTIYMTPEERKSYFDMKKRNSNQGMKQPNFPPNNFMPPNYGQQMHPQQQQMQYPPGMQPQFMPQMGGQYGQYGQHGQPGQHGQTGQHGQPPNQFGQPGQHGQHVQPGQQPPPGYGPPMGQMGGMQNRAPQPPIYPRNPWYFMQHKPNPINLLSMKHIPF